MNKQAAQEARKLIASHLKQRRLELKITQDELAEKMGIKKSYLSRLENGLHHPSLDLFLMWTSNLNTYFFIEAKDAPTDNAQIMRERWGKISNN